KWVLVPRPANVNVVRSMWLFKHKFNADGSLSSLVVKSATIRTVLSLAVSCDWPIHQLDVQIAFLLGHLSETVCMHHPSGFADPNKPNYRIIASIHSEFAITDFGSLNYFLESKLGSDGDPVNDPTLYRNLAGALQYLTFTRPNLSYAVQHVCLYMHDPRDPHFTALNILCYVCGTLYYGLQLHVSSTTQLSAYTDAD
nr:hypothetical protein [Tanacetum cinerariifolium]